ncbi:hypothetical protein Pint_14695 [Pistacia integerrima]|uniref:Uncharacterized protein n=1 Tax=Pistacia integerrima TaxID=434235 RepID=A0ACC0Y614_9ROSI|nr:hypothetical protein Pint_14695 [Pistacia integerrima]
MASLFIVNNPQVVASTSSVSSNFSSQTSRSTDTTLSSTFGIREYAIANGNGSGRSNYRKKRLEIE